MRLASLPLGLASTSIFLALVPGIQGLPNWLQAKHRDVEDRKNAPRQFYGDPPVYGGYSYPGYGPAPTVLPTSVPVYPTYPVATSENSGEATSSTVSSGKFDLHLAEGMLLTLF